MNGPADKPWKRLQELAEARRDETGRALASLSSQRDGAQSKLAMLVEYRREYEARLARASQDGIDAERLRNYRRFLAQLDQAIEQQADQMVDAQSRVDVAQQQWRGEQREVKSYDTLGQRDARRAVARQNRSEQQQQDEYATVSRLRKLARPSR